MIIFFDTNLLLDYIDERRDNISKSIMDKLFISSNYEISTSLYNIVEVVDKLKEITTIKNLVNEGVSFDELLRKRKENKLYKKDIDYISENVSNLLKMIEIYMIKRKRDIEDIIDIAINYKFKSQDALIIFTYLSIPTNDKVFFTKDKELVREVKANYKEFEESYNLYKGEILYVKKGGLKNYFKEVNEDLSLVL